MSEPREHSESAGAEARARLATLADLAKLRLVSLVLVTTAVGFLLAGAAPHDWLRLALTLLGTALTAAGSMALNQLLEAERDARMVRTRRRPIPAGEIRPRTALLLGLAWVASGSVVLAVGVNLLTAALGLTVVALYVAVYTPLKTRSTLCTLVGAVCGAIPPMMGWAAASGALAFGAWLLAALLFFWQIPHFLALAWLYRDDYARGGFRVLPVVDGGGRTTTSLANLYILPLLPVGAVAALAGLTGWTSAVGGVLLGACLLAAGLHLARTRSDAHARRLFLATLAYLPLVLGLLVADQQPAPFPTAVIADSSAATLSTTGGGDSPI